jgi:hypothetical protein
MPSTLISVPEYSCRAAEWLISFSL